MSEARRKRAIRRSVLREWRRLDEPRDTSHHLRTVGELVPGILERLGIGQRMMEERLAGAWASVVGEYLAQHSRPLRLEHRVLHIGVSQPTLLCELDRELKPRLLAKLQQEFGRDKIRSLRFMHG